MFSLKTDPPEAGRSVNSDLDGNTTVTLWFAGESERLVIDTHCVVETLRDNPFDFIVSDLRFLDLPTQYPREQKSSLRPYTTVSRKTALAVSELRETIPLAVPGKNHGFYSHALRVHTQELPPRGEGLRRPLAGRENSRGKNGVLQGSRGAFRKRLPLGGSCLQARKRLRAQQKEKKR